MPFLWPPFFILLRYQYPMEGPQSGAQAEPMWAALQHPAQRPWGTRSHWGGKKRHRKGLHPSRNLLQPEQPQGSGDLGCSLLWEATAMGNKVLDCRRTALPCNVLLPLSPKQGSLHKTFTLRVAELPTLIRLLRAAIKCFCHLGGWCDSIKASKSQQNSPLGPIKDLLNQTQSSGMKFSHLSNSMGFQERKLL